MNRHSKADDRPSVASDDDLSSLGLGPDAPLMNEPKIFVDGRFLASLIAELESELGPAPAARALFQIGVSHGVRAARLVLGDGFSADCSGGPSSGLATAALVMQIAPLARGMASGIGFDGCWPEAHEASARLARQGRADAPACMLSAGFTSGWLSELHDLDIVAVEHECSAQGAPVCRFRAIERGGWQHETDGPTDRLPPVERHLAAAAAPFGPVRDGRDAAASLDPADEAVHVWGPVMVLPFTRPEDALATIGVLGRETGTAAVRVVVIDLRNRPLDPDLGAEMLEQTLDAVEAWGAEVVLTGVCSLTAPVIAELASHHLLTQKDLPEAVASAFQIAEAQRHPL